MKRLLISLALVGLLCAVVLPSSAQKKKDRGHWALVYNTVLTDGKRSNGYDSGVASAMSGSATFNSYYHYAASFKPDGTATVNGRSLNTSDKEAYRNQVNDIAQNSTGTTRIQVGGSRTPESSGVHKISVSWTKPPQYVKVGEENKIAIDIKATYNGAPFSEEAVTAALPGDSKMKSLMSRDGYSASLEVAISPEISAAGVKLNFDQIKAILSRCSSKEDMERYMERLTSNHEDQLEEAMEKLMGDYESDMGWDSGASNVASARLANSDPWLQALPLNKNAYMLVIVEVSAEKRRGPLPSSQGEDLGTVSQVYLYQCFPEGGDVEIETRTDDEKSWIDGGGNGGENEGTELPPWVIPVGVATGGFIIARNLVKKVQKRVKEKDNPQEPEKKEEEKPKQPSTFKMILYKEFGSTLMVGDEPKQVGARIEEITAEGQHKDRRDLTAKIEISEGANIQIVERGMAGKYRCARVQVQNMPADGSDEGFIYFTFRTPGGALRNKVIFKIEDGRVEFFQENLTLPAFYYKDSKLPFVVHGASPEATIEARIDSEKYGVTLEKGEVKGLWYAHIQEKEPDPGKKEAPGKAGHYTIHHLTVTATEPNQHQIEGQLPVLRYNMGLVFECEALVGCYSEPYNPSKHPKHLKIEYNGKAYAPAVARATYSLLTWDEEDHRLKRLVPADETTRFLALPLDEETDKDTTDYLSKETQDMTDLQLLDKLNIQIFVKEIMPDGSSSCVVHACSLLDAPARRKVKLHLETVYKDEKYVAEQEVWLTSQPVRSMSIDQMKEITKDDDHTTDQLWHICDYIRNHDLFDRIGPVYKLAQMQLDAYDLRFGYDPGLVYLVRSTFLRFINGDMLGANAEAEPVEDIGLAAELLQALAKTSEQAEAWLETHGGVYTRLALGVATLGWSETALTAVKVAKDMVDVANRPQNPGGAWEAFFVGVKTVVIDYASEQVMAATMGLGAEFVATYRPDIAANAARLMENTVGTVQKKMGVLAKDVREVARDLKSFASDRIGRQMGSRLKSTKVLKSNMTQSTEDIIRDFRKNSKWTPEDVLEDEIGRAANAGKLKKIKEFEHAYLEYRRYRTPETEEIFRKYCYEFQVDKTAQKQLALYKGDWADNVRSEYYRTLKKDYRLVDKDALQDAAKRLREMGENVDEEDLFVFCATNSNEVSLLDGTSLTRDRDVSLMYRPRPTKANPHPLPKEVPQNIAEECYGNAYKKRTGLTMEQGDQAVVQKGSKEMIGAGEQDLNRGFKKEHFNEKFTDVDGVATAFEHKPEAWLMQGQRLRAAGDIAGAIGKEEEGLRQAFKLYFKSIEPRGTYRGTLAKLTTQEKEMFYLLKKLEVVNQDPFSLSVPDMRKLLKDRYNMDLLDIPKKLKEIVYRLEA